MNRRRSRRGTDGVRRIFSDHAYGPAPAAENFWASRIPDARLMRPPLTGDKRADVAVIGAGFTGLSAALHLAQAGAEVVVLDAQHPGWGASGRNGGFCCLGGAKADGAEIARRHGTAARDDWHRTEVAAIALVEDLLRRHAIAADRHSSGETVLAHNRRAMNALVARAGTIAEAYGVVPILHDKADLQNRGMAGPFLGGMTTPLGFALDPRAYIAGLTDAAEAAGARIHGTSPVLRIDSDARGHSLSSPGGQLRAARLILATNGYSADDLPPWMAGRYMPAQSNVLVTRPLTLAEQSAGGWTSDQMAYDSRNLLHYFRLMPDGRFLFGRRGGLLSSPAADRRAIRATRAHFDRMFPAWSHVETPFNWSGMVCLAPDLTPYCGPIPDRAGAYAGFAYHGNGVAMASHTGALLADLALDRKPQRPYPQVMQLAPGRFPLGRWRRTLMPAAYAMAGLADLR